MLVKEIMRTSVATIHPEGCLRQVAEIILEHGVTGLPVLDAKHRLLGLVQMKDILQTIVHRGNNSIGAQQILEEKLATRLESLRAGNVMATNVHSVKENDSLLTALSIIVNFGLQPVPVLRGEKLVGVVHQDDLVSAILHHRLDPVVP